MRQRKITSPVPLSIGKLSDGPRTVYRPNKPSASQHPPPPILCGLEKRAGLEDLLDGREREEDLTFDLLSLGSLDPEGVGTEGVITSTERGGSKSPPLPDTIDWAITNGVSGDREK